MERIGAGALIDWASISLCVCVDCCYAVLLYIVVVADCDVKPFCDVHPVLLCVVRRCGYWRWFWERDVVVRRMSANTQQSYCDVSE